MPHRWRLAAPVVLSVLLGLALAARGCDESIPQLAFAYDDDLPRRLARPNPHWPTACDRAPEERISLPPPLYEEALLSQSARVPADLVREVSTVLKQLPQPFARLFARHICAVVWMHRAPMTGTMRSLRKDRTRGIILINVDNLGLSPDEWLGFKESSVFEPNEARQIRGTMAEPGAASRAVLLEFLLVHELAHVLDEVFETDPQIAEFKRVSWPRTDSLADLRTIHYSERRGGIPLPDSQLEAYYDMVGAGAFSDPSATDNAREDFAESVSTYLHGVMRGRPWKLEAWRNGQLVRTLTLCWGEPRCQEKQRILEALLQRWDSEG